MATVYRYFVAFAFPPGAQPQFGNLDVERVKPIAGIADVRHVERDIRVRLSLTVDVTVTGWRQFEDDPETE